MDSPAPHSSPAAQHSSGSGSKPGWLDDFPQTLPAFDRAFRTERACEDFIYRHKWPDGFICPHCQHKGEPWRIDSRRRALECRECGHQVNITAGTVFEQSKKPLRHLFRALFEVVTLKTGCSAAHLKRIFGWAENTALMWMRKFRAAMVNPDRGLLHGQIEADTVEIPCQDEEGKRCVALVAIAVEVRLESVRKTPHELKLERQAAKARGQSPASISPFREVTMPGRVRMKVLADGTALEMATFLAQNVQPSAQLYTDGGTEFAAARAAGVEHHPEVMAGNKAKMDSHLGFLSLAASNLKSWIQGTFHGSPHRQFLQGYLDEFCYRHNRRRSSHIVKPAIRWLQQAACLPSVTWRAFWLMSKLST